MSVHEWCGPRPVFSTDLPDATTATPHLRRSLVGLALARLSAEDLVLGHARTLVCASERSLDE